MQGRHLNRELEDSPERDSSKGAVSHHKLWMRRHPYIGASQSWQS